MNNADHVSLSARCVSERARVLGGAYIHLQAADASAACSPVARSSLATPACERAASPPTDKQHTGVGWLCACMSLDGWVRGETARTKVKGKLSPKNNSASARFTVLALVTSTALAMLC
eukprot:5637974-Pleurochrysis_carterae.AAC.1